MRIRETAVHTAAIGLVVIWMSSSVHAQAVPSTGQTYPARPIRLIVPWPPGGGSDVIARIVAPRVTRVCGSRWSWTIEQARRRS